MGATVADGAGVTYPTPPQNKETIEDQPRCGFCAQVGNLERALGDTRRIYAEHVDLHQKQLATLRKGVSAECEQLHNVQINALVEECQKQIALRDEIVGQRDETISQLQTELNSEWYEAQISRDEIKVWQDKYFQLQGTVLRRESSAFLRWVRFRSIRDLWHDFVKECNRAR